MGSTLVGDGLEAMGKRKAEATDEKRAADEKPKKARKAEATDAKRKTDEKPKKARWRDRTPRTVLISNLARTTSSSGLRELVEEYADVADVRIMKSTTGKKKSASAHPLHAYVELRAVESLQGVVETLDGADYLGRRIAVRTLKQQDKAAHDDVMSEAQLAKVVASGVARGVRAELFDARVERAMRAAGEAACEAALRKLSRAGSTPAALTSDFLLGLLSQHKVVAGFARAAAPSPVSRRGGRGAMSRDSKPRGASRGSGVSGRLASKSGRGIGFHRKGKKASKGKQSR